MPVNHVVNNLNLNSIARLCNPGTTTLRKEVGFFSIHGPFLSSQMVEWFLAAVWLVPIRWTPLFCGKSGLSQKDGVSLSGANYNAEQCVTTIWLDEKYWRVTRSQLHISEAMMATSFCFELVKLCEYLGNLIILQKKWKWQASDCNIHCKSFSIHYLRQTY